MNDDSLSSFGDELTVAVIGASGGVGKAFLKLFADHPKVDRVYAYSRSNLDFDDAKVISGNINIESEESIRTAAEMLDNTKSFDIVIVATGILHNDVISPEKSLRDLNGDQFAKVFSVNSIGPALIAKYFLPKMRRGHKSVFACLSARVGSISDNRLGGWYAYRASKAALNMILKNAAIETARRNKYACVIGLHPGTVDTDLSKPYQSNVASGKLFTPELSSEYLLKVINEVTPVSSGSVLAWDGSEIPE